MFVTSAFDPKRTFAPTLEADGASARDLTFRSKGANGRKSTNRKCKTEVGELSAARHPRERLGGNEHSAMIIERTFGIMSITRSLLNQFAICLENSSIAT